ncbi:MAG: RNA pyrophosphohydrolase [Holosporaceae bacterium]|jgi:putative (di)nucleoside polyphosphate hydrolase|nr:RNA pyrophosphohydrolase [Holosporaceae bacterium]
MLSYRKCVAIILQKDSKVFVGRRIDIKNAWQLPQGGVEENEAPLEAAKRELFEETNISSIAPLGSSSSYYYDFPPHVQRIIISRRGELKYRGQEITFFAFKFLGKESEIDLRKSPQEFVEYKWIYPQELLRLIVRFKRRVYEQALKEFRNMGPTQLW